MASDINERSAGAFGNLLERVSLEEVEMNRFLLLRGEPFLDFVGHPFTENSLDRLTMKWNVFSWIGQMQSRAFEFIVRIKVAGVQVAAPVEGAMIGGMKDPRTRGSPGAVKQGSLTEEIKKDFLDQIVGFRLVAQNAEG